MKRKGIFILAVCVCAVLCSSTVYAFAPDEEAVIGKKLAKLNDCEEKIESIIFEESNSNDETVRRELKGKLKEALQEEAELEVETGTYDYRGELEVSIHSIFVAIEDSETYCGDKLTMKDQERFAELRVLCENYSKAMNVSDDYGVLLSNFRKEVDEVNCKYY